MYYPLKIKTSYNFLMRAAAILGTGYENATVMGILDFDTAFQHENDLVALHTTVYPYLPSGVSRDPRDLLYVRLKTSSGDYRVIAMDWIAAEPTLVTSQTVKVIISDVSLEKISLIRNILVSNGFEKFDISVVSNP